MPLVRIPLPMQSYTGGKETVEIDGQNIRQLIDHLDTEYPGIKSALMDEDKLKPDVAVVVDGQVAQLGLLQSLQPQNEILFIPAISGG